MKNTEISPRCFLCNRRNMLWILFLVIIILALAILLPAATVSFFKPHNQWEESFLKPSQKITVASTSLTVAIADSNEEIVQGLSNRGKLKNDQGLLFIFQDSDYRTFWMKDMHFNIDMIFISNNKIVDIAKNMPAPRSLAIPAIYKSQSPADMVLEVNTGLSDHHGWQVGDAILINK